VVTDLQDSIELSVPVSKLTLVIPRGNLASVEEPRTGATANPRYFHFVDEKRGLVLTGWFEAASSWSGFEKFWIGELRAMKNGGVSIRKAPDVVAAGPWQAAAYDVDLPKKVTSANVRAELISAGTWIDIHISVTSDLPESEERDQAVQFSKEHRSQGEAMKSSHNRLGAIAGLMPQSATGVNRPGPVISDAKVADYKRSFAGCRNIRLWIMAEREAKGGTPYWAAGSGGAVL
jgi:hypothetical protein